MERAASVVENTVQILVADDDPISRRLAEHALSDMAVSVRTLQDGSEAWEAVNGRAEATLLILDRVMPGHDGVELCKRARLAGNYPPLYIVMVTSAGSPTEVAEGLDAGADDYVVKPFNRAELRARAHVGMRMLALQESLARRVTELEAALANVKALRGLLPMCSYCKKIRVDDTYWQQLEGYITEHSDAQFSHGICPECYPALLDQAKLDP
ncbi:MAG: two-component system response regulator [Vicinamibacterales bacterium]